MLQGSHACAVNLPALGKPTLGYLIIIKILCPHATLRNDGIYRQRNLLNTAVGGLEAEHRRVTTFMGLTTGKSEFHLGCICSGYTYLFGIE